MLNAEQIRNQATAQILVHLQLALHHFEQALSGGGTLAQSVEAGHAVLRVRLPTSDLMTLQGLLQACNTLDRSLEVLISNRLEGIGGRVLGADSGVAALRSRIRSTLLLNVDGQSLIHYGLQLNDQGVYGCNIRDCQATMEQNPNGLAVVLGRTGVPHPSGVLGAFIGLVRHWTDVHTGLIRQRLRALDAHQRNTMQRRAWLCARCEQALAPRLAQLRLLQRLQADLQMTGQRLLVLGSHDPAGPMPA
ncbi:hypothetical protein PSQ20_21495 [Curvibacter sp. RS43]|uniref:hypothetical protein n=1 Tax=Curvibacter microcysteis TaxID=3026419 RepID=UPI0023602760|nr:hypothetical protein [Curvibacter sp. RS43]MDD0812927.1 hypothetical protein [Curvibacter sp. RS43]